MEKSLAKAREPETIRPSPKVKQTEERSDLIRDMRDSGFGLLDIFKAMTAGSEPKPKYTQEQRDQRTKLYVALGCRLSWKRLII